MSEDPADALRRFLASDLITEPTRAVLTVRLHAPTDHLPQFFTASEYDVLQAVAQGYFSGGNQAAIAKAVAALDERLTTGSGDGWRYAVLPPDPQAMREGLQRLEILALAQFGASFAILENSQQERILADFPADEVSQRFLEDLRAELTSRYYSDPDVQLTEIGSLAMADGRGWQAISLGQREPWEPPPYIIPPMPPAPAPKTQEPLAQSALPMRRYGLNDEVDAVIIGTGAGGAPLLARLAQAGLKVVALEAGHFWDPAHDFATDEREQEKLFWTDERLSAGQDPLAFGANNSGIGVGGSTLHYTAYTPRAHPNDFRIQTEFGVGRDWPLSYSELAPYYAEVEVFLGVSGPASYPWDVSRPPYPLAPLPLNSAARLMERGCRALGIRTSPAPNAALSAPYHQPGVGWRAACANRGFCQAGCSVGAKASMDVTYIPLAIGAGAEVRSECFVMRLEQDKAGRVAAVVYQENGQERRQRCRAVFLCAGAVETPRLLLLNGLGNTSGQVGRNFLAHAGLQLWGTFDDETHPWKGIPGALISEDMHRPPNADFAGGYLLQSLGVMPVTYANQLARGTGVWGAELRSRLRAYPHAAGINICGECLPSPENRLELSEERDARGLPKPRVTFGNSENERRLMAHAVGVMRAIWAAAGAQNPWTFPRNAHTLGTCRMGLSPADSVVDADCRVHGFPNLYIMDGSVFPSSLSVNPALTIMALSLRAADRFLKRDARNSKRAA